MLNGNQKPIVRPSGAGQVLRIAIFLTALLLFSGAVTTVQAQKMPGAFSSGGWFGSINPHDHTPYYLPYYEQSRFPWMDFFYPCFRPRCHGRRYDQGYWYPWTFSWGRYDVPNYRWWSFGEGFFDEYGNGGIWMTGNPQLTGELKAIQTMERRVPAVRASREAPRVTHRRGMGSSGISTSRGSSMGSSGGGRSMGSSGGGGSIGSSGGGGGRSGKK